MKKLKELEDNLKILEESYKSLEGIYERKENQLKVEYKNKERSLRQDYKTCLNDISASDLTGIPYVAGMVADIETYKYELAARSLNWSKAKVNREKQIKLREIRAEAKEQIEQAKIAEYQLEYLKVLYPGLSDVLDTDYKDLPQTNIIPEHDPTRDYLSKDEWEELTTTQKNQLALDRYIESHNKTKWQIGRDYELYVGYCYEKKHYNVEYVGSILRLEDMGRDLIVHKNKSTLIIQCKYWSQDKTIHEKHVFQLYGSVICYNIEHEKTEKAKGIFITNTVLSETARKVATQLEIKVIENFEIGDYPRIKCNIGTDEYGALTKIYHLPMDQQYDNVKLDKPGECKAFTVKEAEKLGFRRAYKWHSENTN